MSTRDKIFEYIDTVAESLGVAVEHVYGIIVQQAVVEGVSRLIYSGFSAITLAVAIIATIKLVKYEMQNDLGISFSILTGFLSLALAFLFIILLSTGIKHLLNPEYYAIKDMLNTIRGS